ncbi:MAG TPA: class I SAM-dependent methyltransferase [Desulfuromonadales bacterium]|nr:class I SAM-dependent methyltransferase [Desulfuromonadales bacterium]
MNPEVYLEMAELQAEHWWFAARRKNIAAVIRQLSLPAQAEILEIGCGTGGNLAMLAEFGNLRAMEYDDYARSIAARVSGFPIASGGLPEPVPFDDGQFDLVCLLDVLEHIEDDGAALARIRRLLKPGGLLLVTAPAYGWLYSAHDRAHQHHRRYSAGRFRQLSEAAGFTARRQGYFNTLLFPLIAALRLARKLVGSTAEKSDAAVPPPFVNALLRAVFAAECCVLPWRFFPFGSSVIAVIEARAGDETVETIGNSS